MCGVPSECAIRVVLKTVIRNFRCTSCFRVGMCGVSSECAIRVVLKTVIRNFRCT